MPLMLCWWASWAISWVSHPNTGPLIIPQGVGRHQETVWRWWSIPYFCILKIEPAVCMEPNWIFPEIDWEHAMHITIFKHTLQSISMFVLISKKQPPPMFYQVFNIMVLLDPGLLLFWRLVHSFPEQLLGMERLAKRMLGWRAWHMASWDVSRVVLFFCAHDHERNQEL